MPGSYGTETLQGGERYRLSFTVGGLLASQSRIIASLFIDNGYCDQFCREQPDSIELGEYVTLVRKRAIDENVLGIRTQSANARVVNEVLKRLSTLSDVEIRFLADQDVALSDCRALMWVSMCRYYAIVGEFANEVVRDHYLLGDLSVTYEDYDRFMIGKAMWHPELEELSKATQAKLRGNVFKAMDEAELVKRKDNTLLPSILSGSVASILGKRPESFGFFPMRER
ncbi:DUF1819 family protein [Bifidobacterium scaligerum]|uniref:DUF1819 domain-containing protein n=1 Tax=Bifidobacterium scaligerum TaxID=2052656 RepID=A0A2M9HSV9_9BIFI|nr:DUF1819 family protein [Bifidobacterium scaligerum]PJM79892.1 DUF1819 domain-containing protein [Bifidobacterium scaligerum]